MPHFSFGDNFVFAKAPISNACAGMTFLVTVKLYAIVRRVAQLRTLLLYVATYSSKVNVVK
jgi:hypothetical protein